MARDAERVGEETAKEGLMLLPPKCDFHEVIRPGDRRRQRQQKNFCQGIQYLGTLARIFQRGEVGQDRTIDGLEHGRLRM